MRGGATEEGGVNGEGAVERDVRDATAAAVSAGRAPSSTPNDAARLVRSPLDAALWRGAGRVARETLDRYVRSWWSALDAVLVLALFAFVFGRPFDAAYFATSGFLPLAVLGAVSGSALARGVVPPSGWEAQAFEEGAGSCAAGLLVAVVVVRVAAAALLALLAIVFGRFSDASPWAVLVATVGLALGGALAAGVM